MNVGQGNMWERNSAAVVFCLFFVHSFICFYYLPQIFSCRKYRNNHYRDTDFVPSTFPLWLSFPNSVFLSWKCLNCWSLVCYSNGLLIICWKRENIEPWCIIFYISQYLFVCYHWLTLLEWIVPEKFYLHIHVYCYLWKEISCWLMAWIHSYSWCE